MNVAATLGVVAALMCVSAGAAGPDRHALAQALGARPQAIRLLGCISFEEEPTEFRCRYRLRLMSGRWAARCAYIAIDGSSWVLLDTPGRTC
jgi:hypothetical protein